MDELPFSEDLVIDRSRVDSGSLEQSTQAAHLLLERSTRPDGVFCYNDPLAMGAINTALQAGLRVPEACAVGEDAGQHGEAGVEAEGDGLEITVPSRVPSQIAVAFEIKGGTGSLRAKKQARTSKGDPGHWSFELG